MVITNCSNWTKNASGLDELAQIWMFQPRSSEDRQEILPNDTTLPRVLLEKRETHLRFGWEDLCERLSNEIEELRVNPWIVQSFNVQSAFVTANTSSKCRWRTVPAKKGLHTASDVLWGAATKSKNPSAAPTDTSTDTSAKWNSSTVGLYTTVVLTVPS